MAHGHKRRSGWKIRQKMKKIFRNRKRLVALVIFALVFTAVGAAAYMFVAAYFPEKLETLYILTLPELLPTGYELVEVDAAVVDGEGVVTLTSGCKQIVAHTEPEQADSIAAGLEGYVGERPNTHDLMKDAFESLGITVHMLKITEVRDGTFIGKLIVQKGKAIASLDCRPSDGTALAVRMDAPIYINPGLLEEYGENIC